MPAENAGRVRLAGLSHGDREPDDRPPNELDGQSFTNPQSCALDRSDLALAVGLALVSAVIMLPGLGAQSLANWDEAIYGVISREMLARPGLTLYYDGAPWFEKSPLFFWLTAASAKVFGLTEVALRIPAVIGGVAAVVLQYFVGRRLGGHATGVLAALLLLGVPQFVAYSRLAMTDVPLTAFGLLAVVLVIYGVEQRIRFVAAGAAFALAILTKSAAAFLFLPGLLAFVIALRGTRALWSREFLLAIAVALIIALPWHLWSFVTYGQAFIDQYLFFHVLGRFRAPLEGHQGGPFYYFDVYSYNAGWLTLVHAAGFLLAVTLSVSKRDRFLVAAVVFAVGAFIIVSAQGTKIGWYLTPVYPGVALAAALAFMRLLPRLTARLGAVLCAAALAVPGAIHGRRDFIEQYNILDYSPEVRSLRSAAPLAGARVPLLYTIDVSPPAALFYLADKVRPIDQAELEGLLRENRPFLCLMFRSAADELLQQHPDDKIAIAGSTESLMLLQHE